MRIGIDTLFENPDNGTGGLVYIQNIVAALSESLSGDELYLFTSKKNARLFRKVPGVHLVWSGWSNENRLLRIISQQFLLPFLAKKLKLDVLLCLGSIVPLLSGKKKVLIVTNRLQYDLPKELGTLRRLYRRLVGKASLNRARRVIALSHDLKHYLHEHIGIPAKSIQVIYCGADLSRFTADVPSTNQGADKTDATLLVVAVLWPYKNHEVLLRSLALCKQHYAFTPKLVIAGSDWKGQKQHLSKMAKELGVDDQIQFLGHIPHEEMPRIYKQSTILLYPSLFELFPLPIFESMASGIPIITSNCCSFPELVGKAGICLDPHDEHAWAKAIHSLSVNRELRSNLIERGLTHVQQFQWSDTAKKITDTLRDVVTSF